MTVIASRVMSVRSGAPVPGARVYARLVAPPGTVVRDDAPSLTVVDDVVSDAQGHYQVTLYPQSAFTVAGTYYAVREWQNTTWMVVVPDSATTVEMAGIVVSEPPEPGSPSIVPAFSQLSDVDNSSRDPGDIVTVKPDGRLGFSEPVAGGGSVDQLAQTHVQNTPSTVWVIPLTMTFPPAGLEVFDHLSLRHYPRIVYGTGSVTLYFSRPLTGTAYLS